MPSILDEALERLHRTAPEYGPMGLSNHGPMAVEALVALGREDAVSAWLDGYERQLDPRGGAGAPIAADDWRSALGQVARHEDWAALFTAELSKEPWPTVLRRWAPRLAAGLGGGALHGILRAAHAVRAIADADTPPRRAELAQGLAYWAACYTELPGAPGDGGRLRADEAVAHLICIPEAERPGFGLITVALRQLESFEPFVGVANRLDLRTRPLAEILSDITEAFAAAYLANANPVGLIALIHMVTGPSAVRLLLPYVPEATGRTLVGHAWQAGAALYSAFGGRPRPDAPPAPGSGRDDLIDRAIDAVDEHAIKFTEACLREEAARPSAIYRAAAADVIQRMSSAKA